MADITIPLMVAGSPAVPGVAARGAGAAAGG